MSAIENATKISSNHQNNFWKTLPRPFSVLAPMEDVTDSAFRRFIAKCGRPAVFYTEFTSTDGICSAGFSGVKHRLKYTEDERPLVAQIWGNNPDNYFKTCRILCEMGFDGIDINMGCPVPKVAKKGACSALIDNPDLARELIIAAKEAAGKIPISVKTRLGFKHLKTEEWGQTLLELKPAALIMHGRVAKDLSKYPANWEEIAKVVTLRNAVSNETLVIGNGDVSSFAEIQEKHSKYGVDGVMIGRGIFKNPFIFRADQTSIDNLPAAERLKLLLEHADVFKETWQEFKPFAVLKKYFKIYVSNFPGASELRAKLMEAKSLNEVKILIDSFYC